MIKLLLSFTKEFFFGKGIFIFLVFCFLISCKEDANGFLNETLNYPVEIKQISNFPSIQYDLTLNPPTKNGVELGRRLFYEAKLSKNNTISCGFCHIQENAFTHHGHTVSHGVFDRIGFRNAPPIQNMIYLNKYTWDGVITNLDHQSIIPITTHEEMNEMFPVIIEKLKQTPIYTKLFENAFGSEEMNADKILKALAQFMATMVSSNSKYDKVLRNEGAIFTEEEAKGKVIFQQKCSTCHATDLFTDQSFRNTGLAYNSSFKDFGRYRVTFLESDKMKFRTPSLRNIELTAPYMHDGRFYSLVAVLNHYSDNLEDNPSLDPILKQNKQVGIPITATEKLYLIAFLKTLTDDEFIKNKNLAELP